MLIHQVDPVFLIVLACHADLFAHRNTSTPECPGDLEIPLVLNNNNKAQAQ